MSLPNVLSTLRPMNTVREKKVLSSVFGKKMTEYTITHAFLASSADLTPPAGGFSTTISVRLSELLRRRNVGTAPHYIGDSGGSPRPLCG
jgi:hypothetical protein